MEGKRTTEDVRAELVFGQNVGRLRKMLVGMGLSIEDGEDVLQNVYIEALRYRGGFGDADGAGRWLMRVTVNRCLQELRRRKRYQQKLAEVYQQWARRRAGPETPDQEALSAEEVEAIRHGLQQLDESVSVPLVLKYYCGLNAADIGKIMEIKPGTIRKRLCTGRMVLAKSLLQMGFEP